MIISVISLKAHTTSTMRQRRHWWEKLCSQCTRRHAILMTLIGKRPHKAPSPPPMERSRYYHKAEIYDLQQPLLVNQPNKREIRATGEDAGSFLLIPEMCTCVRLSGRFGQTFGSAEYTDIITVHDYLSYIFQSSHNFVDEAEKTLVGKIVLTRCNNKTCYMDWINTPRSTFTTSNGDISFVEYYHARQMVLKFTT